MNGGERTSFILSPFLTVGQNFSYLPIREIENRWRFLIVLLTNKWPTLIVFLAVHLDINLID